MKQPSKANFSLQKIKVLASGGLSLKYEVTEVIGAETYTSGGSFDFTKEPHPDLTERIREMKYMVAQIFHYSLIKDVANKKEFKADALQKELVRKYVEEVTDKIKVTGISLSGKEDNIGVVITSSFTVDNKQVVALNTPRIMLKGTTRGFEERLEELVEEIKDEAYEFVYNNKVANPEIFDYKEAGKEEEMHADGF